MSNTNSSEKNRSLIANVSLSFVYLTVLSGTCISYLSNGYHSVLSFSDQRSVVISHKGCVIQLLESLYRSSHIQNFIHFKK